MIPLRVCFLWHQHQPDYRKDDGFFLPWVRMHAVKDYVDLPQIMADYPLRHTINLVPSMLMQIDEYASGRQDPVQTLCKGLPRNLTDNQRFELRSWMRTLQFKTMVSPLPRLRELWDLPDDHLLDDQEVLDLQVLLHVAWTGPIGRRDPVVVDLIAKERGYTISERDELLACLTKRMGMLEEVLRSLAATTETELSTTPFHHPILPLLCNSNAALESSPHAEVPNPPFAFEMDAHWHVREALADHEQRFGTQPAGMWPAEGCVSMHALRVLSEHGVRWVATDEAVLKHSLDTSWYPTAPFQPWIVPTEHGDVSILFRDHALSDAIGFEYASWDADQAANNFIDRLLERRTAIVDQHGEEALRWMTVPVILDGENCWEFYPGNGEAFLRSLFSALTLHPLIATVTCSDAVNVPQEHRQTLNNVVAGSWIGGTFDIWIGSPTKNIAWSLIRDVRQRLLDAGDPPELMDIMHTLEASDWFWWYDDRHQAPHKSVFDSEFRSHLQELYTALGGEPIHDLSRPLLETTMNVDQTLATFPVSYGNNTMHDADALVQKITVETDGNWQRMTFHFQRACADMEEVIAIVKDRHGAERRVGMMCDQVLFQSQRHDEGFERKLPRQVSVYLHSTMHWFVDIEEQRSGGRTFSSSMEFIL